MATTYDVELLEAARRLVVRRAGQRGKLSSARKRPRISTCYYALFHYLLDEIGQKVVGAGNDLRVRRRVLARSLSHKGIRTWLDKLCSPRVDQPIGDFLRPNGATNGPVPSPVFIQDLAKAFADAQAKRHDADYDLNKVLSEVDARLLRERVKRVIAAW